MAQKFGKQVSTQRPTAIKTTGDRAYTFEGRLGYERDAKSELYLLAVVNMAGEDTFYESANDRDNRFIDLVNTVAQSDPDWIARFIPFLRKDMFMRSASIVMAAEFARAISLNKIDYNARQAVHDAIQRADEPAEMLAYWLGKYGRPIPNAIRRGVADAAIRLYSPWNAIKYDAVRGAFRPSDVISLTRPVPQDDVQDAVFKWLLDRRYNNVQNDADYMNVKMIANYEWLTTMPQEERYDYLIKSDWQVFKDAGITWEMLSEWAGKLDAAVWQKIIPSMGYMALLRNLRNFDQAGISDISREEVIKRLGNSEEVAKSMQFPFRFLSAWKAVNSMQWASVLEKALDLSTQNVPEFPGRTLVLCDTSGSMQSPISDKSTIARYEVAAVVAATLAKKGHDVDLISYADSWKRVNMNRGDSVLRVCERMGYEIGQVGHGTNTFPALEHNYNNHDRVVIVSDEQAHPDYNRYSYGTRSAFGDLSDHVRVPWTEIKAPIYTFNVAGYKTAHLPDGQKGFYSFGGFSDAAFKMMPMLERGNAQSWPF